MNVKTMLILVVACVACVMAVCWRKEVAAPVAPLASESAEVGGSASGNEPQKRREPSASDGSHQHKAAGTLRAGSDETRARLGLGVPEALAPTNLAARERVLTNLLPALVFHDVLTAASLAETNP